MEGLAELLERVERSLPPALARELRQGGYYLTLGSSGPAPSLSPAPSPPLVRLDPALEEEEIAELEAMASFGPAATGVSNTIFISPDVTGRHAARIKVAIDPPHSFKPGGKDSSISIADGSVTAGEHVPPALLRQLQQFIDLNREVLLAYWDGRIDTAQLVAGLKSIDP
ncbi:hypothetical protein [Bradyrhizobium sp.]|uniref:hypothetical protein n=1 Tax=Bradyrhizobium sp. TaxID=376 RepID=UPI003C45FD21